MWRTRCALFCLLIPVPVPSLVIAHPLNVRTNLFRSPAPSFLLWVSSVSTAKSGRRNSCQRHEVPALGKMMLQILHLSCSHVLQQTVKLFLKRFPATYYRNWFIISRKNSQRQQSIYKHALHIYKLDGKKRACCLGLRMRILRLR